MCNSNDVPPDGVLGYEREMRNSGRAAILVQIELGRYVFRHLHPTVNPYAVLVVQDGAHGSAQLRDRGHLDR